MKIQEYLQTTISRSLESLAFPNEILAIPIGVERPADRAHGEFSTNIAMSVFSLAKRNKIDQPFSSPHQLATAVVEAITKNLSADEEKKLVKNVTVAGQGFINFSLTDQYYFEQLSELLSPQEKNLNATKTSQSYLIEYISPNTNKPLHIGHLRNAALGGALSNILEEEGSTVIRAIEYNNRGLHIIKSVWSYLVFGKKNTPEVSDISTIDWVSLLNEWISDPENWLTPSEMEDVRQQKSDHFVGYWYQVGDRYAEDATAQKIWSEMLIAWEEANHPSHDKVRKIWMTMNNWFYEGYQKTIDILGVRFDKDAISYESDIYAAGKQIVLDAAQKGVFQQLEDGAVKAELSSFQLPDKILLRKDGTGIYMTFDIELTRQRSEKKVDHLLWVVGMDQKLYFQQLFAVAQLLGYGNREKFYHFAYGMVRLPEGKMSSRKGRVIYADDLIEMAIQKAKAIMEETGVSAHFSPEEFNHVAQAVGVGAIKWTMLAQDAQSELTFDIEESVNFSGFAGPYIQYTAARAQSVLTKAQISTVAISSDAFINNKEYSDYQLNSKERELLINLSLYSDIVKRAAAEYAPHHIATYLFTLAQSFNSFYADNKIISDQSTEEKTTHLRLGLTQAVRIILTKGLALLGLEAIERM